MGSKSATHSSTSTSIHTTRRALDPRFQEMILRAAPFALSAESESFSTDDITAMIDNFTNKERSHTLAVMDFETLSYRADAGVGHLRFTPPKGVTVVNPSFARELRDVMVEIEFDDAVRAVSVTAEGKVFCAGGDLNYFNRQGDDLPKATAQLIVDLHAAMNKMNRMPKVFVAGIRGAAGGAGLSMVGAFDLVISGRSTKYTMAYTQAGLTPDGTSSYFIARHIGLRRMLDLTLTNRVLSADEAESWGLVNRVVDDVDVDVATAELAQSFADGPSWALGMAKQVIYNGVDAALEEAGEFEGVGITSSMRRHDGPEGIAAFVEKRPPNFTGR